MLHSFLHFSKAIYVISYTKKKDLMGFRENRLQKLQISAERNTFPGSQIRVYPPFRGHITAFKRD